MICPNCGREISDDSKFCRYCGGALPLSEDQPPFEQQQADQDSFEQGAEEAPYEEEPEGLFKTRLGKILLVVIIVCAAAVVAIAAVWFHARNQSRALQAQSEDYVAEENDSDIEYDVTELSAAQGNMLTPMGALMYYVSDASDESGNDTISHSWSEDGDNWGAVYDLLNNWGDSFVNGSSEAYYEDNYLVASEDLVKECASALYADFDGNLPEAEAFSKKDTSEAQVYIDGKNYCFTMSDRGEDSRNFTIDSWTEHSDGSCTVQVQEYDMNNETLYAAYRFDLVENTFTASKDEAIFVYSVSDMDRIYLYTPSEDDTLDVTTDSDYILPDSDSRYYSEEELVGLTADELRIARNEIYARHGRKFDDVQLQSYFDSKDWYHGTIEPGDFTGDNVLNAYEKANIQTIQSLEGTASTSSGGTEESDFEATWNVIQSYGFDADDFITQNDFYSSGYNYTILSMTLYGTTAVNNGDYYSFQVELEKPLMVPADMAPGETYTATVDEMTGETATFTCIENGNGYETLTWNGGGEYWTENANGSGMAELWGDSADRVDVPFYVGTVRVRRDAVTGDAITRGPYVTIDEASFSETDWFNAIAFDQDGYITQLIFVGD